jgi:hypothetical protein
MKGNLSENILLEYDWRCMELSLDCFQESAFTFSSAKPLDSTTKNFVSVVWKVDEYGMRHWEIQYNSYLIILCRERKHVLIKIITKPDQASPENDYRPFPSADTCMQPQRIA